MTAAEHWDFIPEKDYLAGELASDQKHEYVGGVMYAMAGAKNRHNRIALNASSSLHARLRGKPCQPYNSDTKVRIRTSRETRFYYPDAMVVCRPNSEDDSFQDEPVVMVEVLSESTRRIDEGEKKDAYQTIPSLGVYLLVEQDAPRVVVFRRSANDFERVVFLGLDAVIPLPEIETELPLAEIFEDITFADHHIQ